MSNAIAENAIGGLIASEVHGVIKMALLRITEEIKLARGFKKDLKDLHQQLTRISCLLQGASEKQISNPLVEDWLKTIKDVAEGVDYLLDEWSYQVLKQRATDKLKHRVSHMCFCFRMGHKVRDMRLSIGKIYDDARKLGIRPIHVAEIEDVFNPRDNPDRRRYYQRLCATDEILIGRDEDVTHLVKLLCDPSNTNSDLTVVGVVGMAGLGKTTLSKRVSKVQKVTEYFHSPVIWLAISHCFDLVDALNRMVEMLFGTTSNMKDRQALLLKLQEKLKDKRFLLILDDVWDATFWEPWRSSLHEIHGSKGSTILVTSRDKNVVAKMETFSFDSEGRKTFKRPYILPLQGLSEDDSWSLFMARIFEDNLASREKELIARKMIKYCGGVPLAIRALGDLLRDKGIERWKEIEKSDLWRQEDKNGILTSLRLSYDYLPNMALKKCFSYCAIFGEDEVIEKDKLIYMWMAQGFLQPYDEMELRGEEYFETLLNSSLFQEAKFDDAYYLNVETFKMHDLVWSLACDVAKEECSKNYVGSIEVRHLSIPRNSEGRELALKSYSKLQTCLLYKEFVHPSLNFLMKCRHLRVLNIGMNWGENSDWKPLGSLKHLRYFEITLNYGLGVMQSILPIQITKLYHLQTLCINNVFAIASKPYVALLPKEIGNLVNIRHIHTDQSSIGIPVRLGHLTTLRTLPAIDLEMDWGGRLKDLGLLSNLRGELKLLNLQYINGEEEARSLLLCNKSNLDSLVLKWGELIPTQNNPHVLEALQPNANLKKLFIWNYYGTRVPRWLIGGVSLLSSLVFLRMWDCCFADGNLKLENFRYLRYLSVSLCRKLTVTFPYEGFQCCKLLEHLGVAGCFKIENFRDLSPLTRLRELYIRMNRVEKRDELVGLGLGSLPCLREVTTDELLLFADLREDSPVCKSLETLTLQELRFHGDTTAFPDQLQHLVALQFLNVVGSDSLETLPDWLGKLISLRELNLSDLPKLKSLPYQDVMQSLSNLKSLNLDGFPVLEKVVDNESGQWFKIAINFEMNWGGRLSDLRLLTDLRGELELQGLKCINGEEEACSLLLGNKSNLDSLVLKWDGLFPTQNSPLANEILEALQPNASLKKLFIWNYDGTRFPRWLIGGVSLLSNLVFLRMWDCCFADGNLKLENFRCLRYLSVSHCHKLTVTFPYEGFQCCKLLEHLGVAACFKIENFRDLSPLTQLRELYIRMNCVENRKELTGLELGSLPRLKEVTTDELLLFKDLREDSPVCQSLEKLTLQELRFNGDITALPDQLQHLVSLQHLDIVGSDSLEMLPDWLGTLTSLKELNLSSMPKLRCLPSQDTVQRLSNLKFLSLHGCPLLETDAENESGEWFKIAHIPGLRF